MGCGSSGTNTVTQNSSPPPQALQAYSNLINQGTQVASQPLQQYSGPMVAGFTPDQLSAMSTVRNAQGIAQPYINAAAGLTSAGATPLSLSPFNNGAISQYMNPYTQNVIDTTQAEFANQNAQQQQQLTGNAISKGAWGGDRAGVAQGILAGQQTLAQAPVIAGLYNQNYSQGLQEFNQQQAAQLQAQQASGWLAENAGFGMAGLGSQALNTTLGGASAQLQSGALQQGLAQQDINIPYEQFIQQQAYPFQTTSYLGGLTEGVGSMMGGSAGTQYPAPSALGTVAGLGMAGLGVYGLGQSAGLWGGSQAAAQAAAPAAASAASSFNPFGNGTWRGGRINKDAGGGISSFNVPDLPGNVPDPSQGYVGAAPDAPRGPGVPQAPDAPSQDSPFSQGVDSVKMAGAISDIIKRNRERRDGAAFGGAMMPFGSGSYGSASFGNTRRNYAGGGTAISPYISGYSPGPYGISGISVPTLGMPPDPNQGGASGGMTPVPQLSAPSGGAGASISPTSYYSAPPAAQIASLGRTVPGTGFSPNGTLSSQVNASLAGTEAGAASDAVNAAAAGQQAATEAMISVPHVDTGSNLANVSGTPASDISGVAGTALGLVIPGAGLVTNAIGTITDASNINSMGKNLGYSSDTNSLGAGDMASATLNKSTPFGAIGTSLKDASQNTFGLSPAGLVNATNAQAATPGMTGQEAVAGMGPAAGGNAMTAAPSAGASSGDPRTVAHDFTGQPDQINQAIASVLPEGVTPSNSGWLAENLRHAVQNGADPIQWIQDNAAGIRANTISEQGMADVKPLDLTSVVSQPALISPPPPGVLSVTQNAGGTQTEFTTNSDGSEQPLIDYNQQTGTGTVDPSAITAAVAILTAAGAIPSYRATAAPTPLTPLQQYELEASGSLSGVEGLVAGVDYAAGSAGQGADSVGVGSGLYRAGGRIHRDMGGGLTGAGAAMTGMTGQSPQDQQQYSQFAGMSEEQLQELTVRMPPNSPQGMAARKALMAKRMGSTGALSGTGGAMSPAPGGNSLASGALSPTGLQPNYALAGLASGGRAGFEEGGSPSQWGTLSADTNPESVASYRNNPDYSPALVQRRLDELAADRTRRISSERSAAAAEAPAVVPPSFQTNLPAVVGDEHAMQRGRPVTPWSERPGISHAIGAWNALTAPSDSRGTARRAVRSNAAGAEPSEAWSTPPAAGGAPPVEPPQGMTPPAALPNLSDEPAVRDRQNLSAEAPAPTPTLAVTPVPPGAPPARPAPMAAPQVDMAGATTAAAGRNAAKLAAGSGDAPKPEPPKARAADEGMAPFSPIDFSKIQAPAHEKTTMDKVMQSGYLPILIAGAATLQSRSPYAGARIGAGITEGVKTLQGQVAAAGEERKQQETATHNLRSVTQSAAQLSELANYHRASLARESARDLATQEHNKATETHQTELADIEREKLRKGYWEPSAPVMGEDGKPKLDPQTGQPMWTWVNRYSKGTLETSVGPAYDVPKGAGQASMRERQKLAPTLFPNDMQAQADFIAGKHLPTSTDIAQKAAAQASKEYENAARNNTLTPEQKQLGQTGWIKKRTQEYVGEWAPHTVVPSAADSTEPPAAAKYTASNPWRAPADEDKAQREFDALKPGTPYINPADGKLYTKS